MSIQQYFRVAQQLARELEPAVHQLDDARRHPTSFLQQQQQHSSHSQPFQTAAHAGGGHRQQEELQRLDQQLPELEEQLAELRRTVQFLQGAVDAEGRERRELWRSRVQSLLQEVQTFNAALLAFRQWRQGLRAEHNRQLLLGGGDGSSQGGSNASAVGAYIGQQESLLRSRVMIEEQVAIGRDALSALSEQRRTLKSARTKLLDLGHSLGLSGSIIRTIERQEFSNRLITYAGMLTVLVLLVLVYWAVQPAAAWSLRDWLDGQGEAAVAASAELLVEPLDRGPPVTHGRRILYL